MAAQALTIDGLDFVRSQLRDFLPREANAILRRTVTKIAATVRTSMRERAPVARGVLRKAITSRRERGNRDEAVAAVYISKGKGARHDAYYWHWVEFGTVDQPPRPFITPAVEAARASLTETFRNEFGRQLERQMAARAKGQRT